jgi:RHS repeat-associated protein
LASELTVFRALRDRWLAGFSAGERFIAWYYKGGGPTAAKWLQSHDTARLGTRIILSALAVPLRAFLFGKIVVLLLIFLCALCVFVVSKKFGWKWGTSITSGFVVALTLTICYSYLMDVPEASASYTQSGIYYYTSDHIGRPFALRDQSQELTWYERHYVFGDQIDEWADDMPAGLYERQISWKPNFRFPGQYQDDDMGLSATGASLFVQNHYREYMPSLSIFNRNDPFNTSRKAYYYVMQNPLIRYDKYGLYFLECSGPKDSGHLGYNYLHLTFRCCRNGFTLIHNPNAWSETEKICGWNTPDGAAPGYDYMCNECRMNCFKNWHCECCDTFSITCRKSCLDFCNKNFCWFNKHSPFRDWADSIFDIRPKPLPCDLLKVQK